MSPKDNKLLYQFEAVGHGDEDGFNDPVKTTFDTNISRVVAREAIQNIIDASTNTGGPAIAEFHLHYEEDINNSIPNLSDLQKIISACKEHYPQNKQCVAHFEHALDLLKGPKIGVLVISDYNTKGLSGGDDDRQGDYYCFLKSVGASAKAGNEGGSYGLGKGSFYAASALNTIFVSSIYENDKYVFQGKLRLVSHKGLRGTILRGNGSFGYKDEKPVRNLKHIPKYFRRTKQGTDIFIPGYKDTENGRLHIIKSVLSNFWYAILKDYLIVNLHDDITIDRESLERLIHEYSPPGQPAGDDDSNLYPYYDAYRNGQIFKETLPTLGNVELRLIQKHTYPKRVACFRKTGMLIEEKRFSSTVPYAGVFICENDKGNAILRDMESPNHDRWDKNGAHSKINGELRPEIIRADKEYKNFIKSKLKEMTSSGSRQELNIGGLEQFLYIEAKDELESEKSPGGEGELEPTKSETAVEVGAATEKITGRVNPQKNLLLRADDKGEKDPESSTPMVIDGDVSGGGVHGGDEGDGKGEGSGGDSGGKEKSEKYKPGMGEQPVKKILDLSFRSYANQLSSGKIEHVLIIRNGKPKCNCSIRLMVGTDDSFDKITIKKATSTNGGVYEIVDDNLLKGVSLDDNGEAKIKLEFVSNERYSLSPLIYEN